MSTTKPKRPTAAELTRLDFDEMHQLEREAELEKAAAMEPQQAAKPKLNKAELQQFIQSSYRVEFNELTCPATMKLAGRRQARWPVW